MSFHFDRKPLASGNAHAAEPVGDLLCLRHESSGGSMAYRSEFEIELNEKEIVRCACWPQNRDRDMVRKEHVPVTAEQWADVVEIVQTLRPLFHEVEPNLPTCLLPQVHVLDGGDYSRWFLTWQTPEGVRTAQYYQPDDRRICTLIELLHELAEPIGRKIPRFDPPELCGVFYSHNKNSFSFQCTPWDDKKDGYRLIVYEESKRCERSLYERVPVGIWSEVHAFLEPLEEKLLSCDGNRRLVTCTLYYSDGKQECTAPDDKTADKLQDFFACLADRVQSEISKKGDA